MRHRKTIPKLGRKADHRKALLRNLSTSLAIHGKVKTTTAKAKALVSYYEKLISYAKRSDKVNAIRNIKKYLFTIPAQKAFMDRLESIDSKSGYLRTTKVGFRNGDMAEMTLVEHVSQGKVKKEPVQSAEADETGEPKKEDKAKA